MTRNKTEDDHDGSERPPSVPDIEVEDASIEEEPLHARTQTDELLRTYANPSPSPNEQVANARDNSTPSSRPRSSARLRENLLSVLQEAMLITSSDDFTDCAPSSDQSDRAKQ